jgi:endonuclease/exonuclease/phosphatase family metal-dependent hydrolase
MQVLTWNIQYGLGVDGSVDLRRIARRSLALGRGAPPDVICYQEVAVGYPELDGGLGADQPALLAAALPEYRALFRAAIDRPEGGRRFGNMVLSRLPVHDVAAHILPEPPAPDTKTMRRLAIEASIGTPRGPLRIVTTHLAYHDEAQRAVQTARLRALYAEATARQHRPGAAPPDGPYVPAPAAEATVLCGDFNLLPDADPYLALQAPFDDGTPALVDAWRARYGDRPHDPTCGLFDREQWDEGPHCRDYFFVTPDLAARTVDLVVDLETDASDHQPLLLVLRD